MSKIIKATLPAYARTGSSLIDPSALQHPEALTQDQKARLLSTLLYTNGDWIKEEAGYMLVGTVEIEFRPTSTDEMVRGQVEALQARRKKILAEATREANRIQEMISKLQALPLEA